MKLKRQLKIFVLYFAILYLLFNIKLFMEQRYYKSKISEFMTHEKNNTSGSRLSSNFYWILGDYEYEIENSMTPIGLIPISLIGSFIIYTLYLINYNLKRHIKAFVLSLILFYLISNLMIYAQGIYYDYQLAKYDLTEYLYLDQRTSEYDKAHDNVMNDTARNFAPFTLAPVSFAFSILYLIMYSIIVYISKIVKSTRAVNGRSS